MIINGIEFDFSTLNANDVDRMLAAQTRQQERARISTEEQRQASTDISNQLTQVSQHAFETVAKDGSWLFKEGEDPKWNEGVKARKDAVMGYLRAGNMPDLARLIAEGVAAPIYRKGYEQMKAAYDDLKSRVEGTAVRRPSVGGHAPASDAPRQKAPIRSIDDAVDLLWDHM